MKKELIHMDALDWLNNQSDADDGYRMMFADPPDGIGMKYNGFTDKISPDKYERMLYTILTRGADVFDFMWLSINPRWTLMMGHVGFEFEKIRPDWTFKPNIQFFTFGQHNHRDFGNNHRLLYRWQRRDTTRYMDAVRVPSWRQLNGDKRADPRGRVPGDVFEFPRVTGNSKQRRKFSPTQLHQGLYERCIRSCCQPFDTVVDLFAGSGTLGKVSDQCRVHALMIEKSKQTCKDILKDQPDVVEVKR
ncbi:MAG: DNA methyltransferase [Planctomycetota bacterium]|jgi:hypothetical protein